ncbi:MAG: radical SAM protein [Candidatus Cloacimonadota bacterium]|nr:radical SAM protein [Candidatus Cloacimonadota bacterium]
MELSEIFYSIQGESTFAGLPCIFIRLSGCNLRCVYCDTKYAYTKEFELSVDEILKEIKKYSPISLVEVTGGEPLLQEDTYLLLDKLIKEKYQILLETNGSILLNRVPKEVIKIVDIKTPGSKMSHKMNWENINYLNLKDEIKFVITDKKDFDWAIEKVKDYNLLQYNVLFSPAYNMIEPRILAEWIKEEKIPIRMQLQLHKIIYNDRMRKI